MSDARVALIRDWLAGELGWPRELRLEPASADASFRRYFRVWRPDGGTRIELHANIELPEDVPEARENAADDGLIWDAHANEEVGNYDRSIQVNPAASRLARMPPPGMNESTSPMLRRTKAGVV